MALCGCLTIVGAALALRALGAGRRRGPVAALALVGARTAPARLGHALALRLWPAALVTLAARRAALGADRARARSRSAPRSRRSSGPPCSGRSGFLWVWRTRGPRAAAGWAAGVVAVRRRLLPSLRGALPRRPRPSFHCSSPPAPAREPRQRAADRRAPRRRDARSRRSRSSRRIPRGSGAHAARGAVDHRAGRSPSPASGCSMRAGRQTASGSSRTAAAAVAVCSPSGRCSRRSTSSGSSRSSRSCAAGAPRAGVLLVAALLLTQVEFPARYWQLANDAAPSIVAAARTRPRVVALAAARVAADGARAARRGPRAARSARADALGDPVGDELLDRGPFVLAQPAQRRAHVGPDGHAAQRDDALRRRVARQRSTATRSAPTARPPPLSRTAARRARERAPRAPTPPDRAGGHALRDERLRRRRRRRAPRADTARTLSYGVSDTFMPARFGASSRRRASTGSEIA